MKVDDLVALGAPTPPPRAAVPSRETIDDISRLYYDIYVPGLTMLFETKWYRFKPQGANPAATLLNNRPVTDMFASFLESLSAVTSPDSSAMATVGLLESRLVWALAAMAYTVPAGINTPSDEPVPADDATEARNRLAVVDTLLSGGHLIKNPCLPPPKSVEAQRRREFLFWWWLAEYLCQQENAENQNQNQGEPLAQLRKLLDGRENRDFLYSLVVVRELAPKFQPGYERDLPQQRDEADPRSKLAGAVKFIRSEAHPTGGTTNVIRRFAELAIKAFISPGVNMSRPA
jgi:white-opaque regulator 2